MDNPRERWRINPKQGVLSVMVDDYLRSDTERGQMRALMKVPRWARETVGSAFKFAREERDESGQRWFVFRSVALAEQEMGE